MVSIRLALALFAATAEAASLPDAAALGAIAAPAGGTVGFAAVDLASGRTLALHPDDAFPMQSVFKLPIAIEVLRQADAGKLDLDRQLALGARDARRSVAPAIVPPGTWTIRALLEAMVVQSDNAACDKLLALVGGPAAVDARMRALGVQGIRIRFSERDMMAGKGDNTATPAAMTALLGKLARRELGLAPATATALEELLLRVVTGPDRLKGALPPTTPVAHKTGSSATRKGKTTATNDVGLISLPDGRRIAIAVFVHDSRADEKTRELTIARLARAAYDAFLPAQKR
jgi:beta-lactamase class A